jgi:N-acetylglucosaminyl-diphospho-decaprenol L-rhamnosyltransferase
VTAAVTVSIVTYNSAAVLGSCLAALPAEVPVWVVDNASTDNTVAQARKDFPKVNVLESQVNLGFGRAHNLALRQITTPYALVLNPDAVVAPGAIAALVAAAEAFVDAAIIGSSYGTDKTRCGTLFGVQRGGGAVAQVDGPACVGFLSGACLLLRMEVFKRIGFFDENLFLFFEDNELCDRARAAGHSLILAPDAGVMHLEGKSSPVSLRSHLRRHYLMGQAEAYYYRKRGVRAGFLLRLGAEKAWRAVRRLLMLRLKGGLAAAWDLAGYVHKHKQFTSPSHTDSLADVQNGHRP